MRANKRNILGEYSAHFKYSLRVTKKNILSDYHSFFEPRAWTDLQLDWINLYHNDLYQNDFVIETADNIPQVTLAAIAPKTLVIHSAACTKAVVFFI